MVAIYCIIDDILKSSDYKFDKRAKLSESEVLNLSIIAMLYFGGVYAHALAFLISHGYFTQSICKSRLHRRLMQLEGISQHLFHTIAELFTGYYAHKEFIIDSTPLEVCITSGSEDAEYYRVKSSEAIKHLSEGIFMD